MSAITPSPSDHDDTLWQVTAVDWSAQLSDQLLDQLADTGVIVLRDVLPEPLLQALRLASREMHGYRAAQLISDGVQQQIRSDATRWLQADDPVAAAYLRVLQDLGAALNQQLFLGIRWAEAHFACYQAGQFYAQHRDNPKSSNVRAISTVLYLNTAWPAAAGGQLRVIDRQGAAHEILPQDNQLVLFDSDLLHEVCPATQVRYSIAGWLRRDAAPEV